MNINREEVVRTKIKYYTPGTAGGPGGRDRTLAVKSRKTGLIWQIGPGSMWQIGPSSMWQIGPGSMWQIKEKDGEKRRKD